MIAKTPLATVIVVAAAMFRAMLADDPASAHFQRFYSNCSASVSNCSASVSNCITSGSIIDDVLDDVPAGDTKAVEPAVSNNTQATQAQPQAAYRLEARTGYMRSGNCPNGICKIVPYTYYVKVPVSSTTAVQQVSYSAPVEYYSAPVEYHSAPVTYYSRSSYSSGYQRTRYFNGSGWRPFKMVGVIRANHVKRVCMRNGW